MKTAFKKTLLSTLVVPFALGVSSAASAAVIQTWDYQVDSNFTDADFTNKVNSNTGSQSVTPNQISWGGADADDQSSVSITDVDSTTDGNLAKLQTGGPAVDGSVFSHNNRTIDLRYDTLVSFDLNSSLTLIPLSPPDVGSTESLPTITFSSFFTETPNDPGDGSCAFGSQPCGDIFTLDNVNELGELNGNSFQINPQSFEMEGVTYTVFLELAGLMGLSDAECAAAGAGNDCVGLLTPENQTTGFLSSFRITADEIPVPEPGTLALLGLGLTGLGLARRKKAAKV